MTSKSLQLYWLMLAILLGIFIAGYLLTANAKQAIGYPLDDAWIHQTYARNLGTTGEWAVIPGKPSGGSTGPLWTFWLSIGYWLRIDHFVWTYFTSALALLAMSIIGSQIASRLLRSKNKFSWFGAFLIGEWHLLWATLSGMETIWFSTIVLGTFYYLNHVRTRYWVVGILVGLSIWLRPDGLTLIAPVIVIILLEKLDWQVKFKIALEFIGGLLALLIPYLLFNHVYSNALWPNTFFAKQAEYAVQLQVPFIQRLLSLSFLPLVGPGLVLAPGFIFACIKFLETRNALGISMVLWWFGFTAMYAWKLPLDYQHGRYLIPSMPLFWLIAWVGSLQLFLALRIRLSRKNLVKFAWIVTLCFVWGAFIIFGSNAYSDDAAIVNTEMVQTARWVAINTSPGALVAIHDIGAMGYFGNRDLIDLAGLISPEVIPIIRDEKQLMAHMQTMRADYLVTFPGWYPEMTRLLVPIYQGSDSFSINAGGEHMNVYWLGK